MNADKGIETVMTVTEAANANEGYEVVELSAGKGGKGGVGGSLVQRAAQFVGTDSTPISQLLHAGSCRIIEELMVALLFSVRCRESRHGIGDLKE